MGRFTLLPTREINMRRMFTCWSLLLAATVAIADVPASQLFSAEGHGRKVDGYFPDDDVRRITALHDVHTPHLSWATPLAGGPVRVLAIAAKSDGRWPVELAQRFDFDVRTVYGHDSGRLGAPPDKGLFVQGQRDVESRILKALADDIDVVVCNIAWDALGETVHKRIASYMRGGMGYVGPQEGIAQAELAPDEKTAAALIAETVPLAGLDLLGRTYPAPEAAAADMLAVWTGQDGHRVADISGYPRDGGKPDTARLQHHWLPRAEQEAYYSLLGRVILWVARPAVSCASVVAAGNKTAVFARGDLPLDFGPHQQTANAHAMRIWDADMRPVFESVERVLPRPRRDGTSSESRHLATGSSQDGGSSLLRSPRPGRLRRSHFKTAMCRRVTLWKHGCVLRTPRPRGAGLSSIFWTITVEAYTGKNSMQ